MILRINLNLIFVLVKLRKSSQRESTWKDLKLMFTRGKTTILNAGISKRVFLKPPGALPWLG